MTKPFSFVTVVHSGEVPLLKLQARGLAKHLAPDLVEDILVLINDRDEDAVRREIEPLRAAYGELGEKLRILGPEDIFGQKSLRLNLSQRIRLSMAQSNLFAPFRVWTGWKGNWGWAVQQAMKLAAGYVANGRYCVILDCKNIPLRPLTLDDFVAPDGRPKANLQTPGKLHNRWLPASLRAVGLSPRAQAYTPLTQFVTPWVVETEFLKDACAHVEARRGPIEALFSVRSMNAALWPVFNYTEFMMLNAYAFLSNPGGVEAVFADDVLLSTGVHASSSETEIDNWLTQAAQPSTKMIGLHSGVAGVLAEKNTKRLSGVLIDQGVIEEPGELTAVLNELQIRNSKRIKQANKRRAA